ncbi:hypothetical protein V502_02382 [Pseudogymnoascus sp. VKM F-4520 (FW-2644)]|nr:hypothetical protein V502_02382 [Pseudogymnoascus sp. VKM F-4520 (FW-2644)]
MFGRSPTTPEGIEKQRNANARIVGEDLANVLPRDQKPFWRKWHLLRLNLILLVPLFTSGTVGYDGAMMNALQIAPFWKTYFGHPARGDLGLVNAIFPIGKVCGLAVVTWMSDKYGRRLPIIIGTVLCIAGAGVQASSVNFAMFIFSRWLVGFGTAFMAQPSPMLITELAFPTHRAKATALFNTFYYFGAILAAWLTFGTVYIHSDWSWRIPSLMQGFFPAIQLAFIVFLPESPRWLIAKGKVEEARAILIYHHAGGDEQSPLVEFEMKEIQEALRLEREIKSATSFKDLFANTANRKRTFIAILLGFYTQWCGNGVISYYLTLFLNTIGIENATDQALINGLLQIFNFIIAVFVGALMIDRLGRRLLFIWSAGGMMLSYVVWTVLNAQFISSKDKTVGIAVIPMIFVFYFHYDIALTPITYAYVAEIFPYRLRGWGITITYLSTYLALMFNLFANPIAMAAISWRYYIVFCCINAAVLLIMWFTLPETKGHTLEEIAVIFEGESAAVNPDLSKFNTNTIEKLEIEIEQKGRV